MSVSDLESTDAPSPDTSSPADVSSSDVSSSDAASADASSSSDVAASTIEVTVLFFGPLRELVGTRRMEVTLGVPATGADLLNVVEDRHPEIHDHRRSVRLAVNQQYVPTMETLGEGDEVALITPVSGG